MLAVARKPILLPKQLMLMRVKTRRMEIVDRMRVKSMTLTNWKHYREPYALVWETHKGDRVMENSSLSTGTVCDA